MLQIKNFVAFLYHIYVFEAAGMITTMYKDKILESWTQNVNIVWK